MVSASTMKKLSHLSGFVTKDLQERTAHLREGFPLAQTLWEAFAVDMVSVSQGCVTARMDGCPRLAMYQLVLWIAVNMGPVLAASVSATMITTVKHASFSKETPMTWKHVGKPYR